MTPPEEPDAASSGGDKRLPVFPSHLIPSSIKRSRFRQFLDSEIASEDDLEHLLELLYRAPEITTYTFHAKGLPMNHLLLSAERLGMLQIVETQGYWYAHPNFRNDFVRITAAEPEFEWERELKKNGQMFFRNELALTAQERRKGEIRDTVDAVTASTAAHPAETAWQHVEEHYRRHSTAYNLAGFVLAVLGLLMAF